MNARVALVGAQVDVAGSEEALIAQSLLADGCTVTTVSTRVSTAGLLLRLARLTRVDIAHVFWGSGRAFLFASVPAMLAARFFGKRVVLHCHRREAEQHLAQSGWLVHPWLALADEIVVPTESAREAFARFGHRGRVIYSAVDLSGYAYRPPTRTGMRLFCDSDLEPGAGIEGLIDAFAMVRLRYPDATLAIAGTGSDLARLRAFATEQNVSGIRFLGAVSGDRLRAHYEEASIFLQPSSDHARAVQCLRAFATGVPVVSLADGDAGGVLRSGVNCVTADRRNSAAVAAAVSALAEDATQVEAVVRHAREDAARHTWHAVRDAWAATYARASAATDADTEEFSSAHVERATAQR